MKTPRKKKSKIKIVLLGIFVLFFLSLLAAGILGIYCLILSNQMDTRFSQRKWSIPSKVYSDSLLLYPGQHFNSPGISEKLHRLGYRKVISMPDRMGEYRTNQNSLTLYLRSLTTPGFYREGFPAEIVFKENQIASITDLSSNKPMALLELEPEEIMLFFGPERERRQLVSITQVPEHVIHAVLSAEDTRFYTHKGMDFRGILRAFFVNLRHAAIKQGGSTITQQLSKNYFLTPERSFSRKFKELCMSVTMELMYDKDEILEIYLNEIYLGQKGSAAVNGIGEASYFYFDKPVSDLSVAEAATIAGLIRGPNRYSPYVDEKKCAVRRSQVLQTMHKNGWIDDQQFHTSMIAPLSPAGYQAYGKKAPYFMDYLTKQLKTLYSPEDLSSLGLSIYTTLDTDVQRAAEKALEKGLTRLETRYPDLIKPDPHSNLQGVVIVMQPHTGNILGMVGGRDYAVSQFNRAVQAHRQPGSAFKPFVYAAALGPLTPASLLANTPKTYFIDGQIWEPKNHSDFPGEFVRMRTALAHSINLATVDLAMAVGQKKILDTLRRFGFSTFDTLYPSAALGAMPVIPLELARAYCPFAANGILPYPLSLKRVADEENRLLAQRHMQITRAMSPEHAFLMNSMLQSVVEEGTAASLRGMGISYPVCGKTGTTNDNRDAWFIGFTPDILALVWVGFDDGSTVKSSGSGAALPIWAELMSLLPQYVSGNGFTKPPGVVKKVICAQTGLLAVKNRCPEPIEEYFSEDHAPTDMCPEHSSPQPLRQMIDEFKDLFSP